jgi:hypothetical protein
MKTKDDPTITRIREARHQISEEYGHDPKRIVEYYGRLQAKYQDKILSDTGEETSLLEPVKV